MENRTLKSEADENKEMLVIDGNAFYEIDLDCMEEKKKKLQAKSQKSFPKKRQQNIDNNRK